jgi:hypothetical protein
MYRYIHNSIAMFSLKNSDPGGIRTLFLRKDAIFTAPRRYPGQFSSKLYRQKDLTLPAILCIAFDGTKKTPKSHT